MKLTFCTCDPCAAAGQRVPALLDALTSAFPIVMARLGVGGRPDQLRVSLEHSGDINFLLALMQPGSDLRMNLGSTMVLPQDGVWRMALDVWRPSPQLAAIALAPGTEPRSVLSVFCHELVHVSQCVTGRLSQAADGNILFDGQTYSRNTDRDDQPWETEAEGLHGELYGLVLHLEPRPERIGSAPAPVRIALH